MPKMTFMSLCDRRELWFRYVSRQAEFGTPPPIDMAWHSLEEEYSRRQGSGHHHALWVWTALQSNVTISHRMNYECRYVRQGQIRRLQYFIVDAQGAMSMAPVAVARITCRNLIGDGVPLRWRLTKQAGP
ncbi:hypothetical protein PAXRUDRAFT_409345 [Paxillus rubicundulus Ve08.2h10]|uniref:Uncharacterized protein n=1 Tax=Paxillus rubicundulus Ve08.2h10 TaxID=930991 RepID=A0A0D0E8M8_9AGAM|nr:hypothetical protein PAXRUDRAFT_409345 [Paxillus rubicundulus Ve08.2h10]